MMAAPTAMLAMLVGAMRLAGMMARFAGMLQVFAGFAAVMLVSLEGLMRPALEMPAVMPAQPLILPQRFPRLVLGPTRAFYGMAALTAVMLGVFMAFMGAMAILAVMTLMPGMSAMPVMAVVTIMAPVVAILVTATAMRTAVLLRAVLAGRRLDDGLAERRPVLGPRRGGGSAGKRKRAGKGEKAQPMSHRRSPRERAPKA